MELLAQLARQLVPDISLDEVSALAFDRASDHGRVVVVTAPEQDKAKLPSEDALAGVFDTIAAKAVDPYVDQVAGAAGLMAEPPAPATIVGERTVPELGVTEITLANGVRVIMKQTDFRENEVIFSATSPGGSSLVADTDFPEADAAAYLVSQSGIGELSQTELQKLLSGMTVGVAPGVFELSEGFSGYAATEDLETAMQLIHLYATQPRLDPLFVEDFKEQARANLVNRQADPHAVFEDALKEALYGNSIRRGMLPLAEIEGLDANRGMEIYASVLATRATSPLHLSEASTQRCLSRWRSSTWAHCRRQAGRKAGTTSHRRCQAESWRRISRRDRTSKAWCRWSSPVRSAPRSKFRCSSRRWRGCSTFGCGKRCARS